MDSIDPAITAHPEVVFRIFQDPKYPVIEQSFASCIASKAAVFQPTQARIIRPNPQHSLSVLIKCANGVPRKSIRFAPALKLSAAHMTQAAVLADPQSIAPIVNDHANVIGNKSVFTTKSPPLPILEPK